MRGTIHLVSKRDFWPLAVAIRAGGARVVASRAPATSDGAQLEKAAAEIRALLAEGPRTHAELAKITGRGWGMVGPWLELVRVPPQGTWEQRRAHLFQTADAGSGRRTSRRTTRSTISSAATSALSGPPRWPTSRAGPQVKPRDLAPALERLRLRRFRDEQGKELLDVPRAPLPDPETPAPVRFLPTWDATLLVHARRTGILPEEYRPLIFSTKTPHSVGTFLVDGSVAGTWRHEAGRIETTPLRRLDRATLREVAEEASRLRELYE